MKWIKRRIRINDDVEFNGQSYAGFTGTTSYVGDNNVWWIDLDTDCISKFSYEYKELCRKDETDLESICLEETSFTFID